MFPLRDENPTELTPFVTVTLIVINVAAWLFVQGAGTGEAFLRSLCAYGAIPGAITGAISAGELIPLGQETACRVGGFGATALLTSMFLHGSWMHLIGNMWFMWIFGNNVEDSMGHGRFIVFYLLCGLAAAVGQVAANPMSGIPMVGASGAIGGVMGAYIVLYPRVQVKMLVFLGIFITTFTVPAVFMLGYWLLIQLLGGLGSIGAIGGGVAFWAHIGGFVGGAILVLFFRNPELVARHPYHGWKKKRHAEPNWRRIK